jgi:hypothetical protein
MTSGGPDRSMTPAEKLDELTTCQQILDSAGFTDRTDIASVTSAINRALAVPPPGGSPAKINAKVSAYSQASQILFRISDELSDIALNKLPAAWRGQLADTARDAVAAVSERITEVSSALDRAAVTGGTDKAGNVMPAPLPDWSQTLQAAQPLDRAGRVTLQKTLSSFKSLDASLRTPLHPSDVAGGAAPVGIRDVTEFNSAIGAARTGIGQMVSAAQQVCQHESGGYGITAASPETAPMSGDAGQLRHLYPEPPTGLPSDP